MEGFRLVSELQSFTKMIFISSSEQIGIQKRIIQAIEKDSYEWLTIRVDNDGNITQE